jgi:GrpB-like predicted nucleotidyltransferase (UPF0157 family)/ribosomal protein S18 acetylase RimI-like enzyme
VIVRPARVEDAAAIARVQIDAWRDTYRGIVPDAHLDALSYEDYEHRRRTNLQDPATRTHVAVDGDVVAFAMSGPERDPATGGGELYAIYVRASHRSRKVGRRLLLHVAEAFAADGVESMVVWVLRDNGNARRFYEAMGGQPRGEKTVEIGGATLSEVGYAWGDLSPLLDARVRIVEPDASWPLRFAKERDRIVAALGAEAIEGIEHVGSTSVPGLAAKPVVDILLAVRGGTVSPTQIVSIERLGYRYKGEAGVPGRQYFSAGLRGYHIHAAPHGSAFWRSHVLFRDRLRADPGLAAGYESLKRRLAREMGDDRLAYTDAKAPFIRSVLEA